MLQNIITLIIVLAAAIYAVYQLVQSIFVKSEKPGCPSCGFSGSCNQIKKVRYRTNSPQFPRINM